MADSSRVQISYLKQTAKGTVQAASFTELRHTGGSFGVPQETVRSDEITGDAQRGAAVRVGKNPEGAINMEFSAQTFDDLIEGFLRSTWSTAAAVSDTGITAVNSSSSFDRATGDYTADDITKGQWVYVGGFADSDINGWYKVTAIASTVLTVSPAPADDSNTEGNTITIEGSYIRNGTADNYFAFQLHHQDLTNRYRLIDDSRIGQMSISSNARERVTGSFNFTGCNHSLESAAAGDGTVTDAPTTEVLNTTDHVTGVFIDDDNYDGCVMSFDLTGNFNSRRQNCVGQLTSNDVKLGSLDTSGNISIYLTDTAWTALLAKYDAFTKIGIAFAFVDSSGNGYVIDLPQVALTNEPGNVPGPDNDVMLDFSWQGEPGTIGDETKTIQISRRQA